MHNTVCSNLFCRTKMRQFWWGKKTVPSPLVLKQAGLEVPKFPVGQSMSWEGTWGRRLLTGTNTASLPTHAPHLPRPPSEQRVPESVRGSWEKGLCPKRNSTTGSHSGDAQLGAWRSQNAPIIPWEWSDKWCWVNRLSIWKRSQEIPSISLRQPFK